MLTRVDRAELLNPDIDESYVSFTATSLTFRQDTPFDAWQEITGRLFRASKAIWWWIGDALNFGEGKYGHKYAQVLDATSYDYQTVANAKWVALHVECSRRREHLRFSHHAEVASLPPVAQDALLDTAESARLTRMEVRELAREVRAEQGGRELVPFKAQSETPEPLPFESEDVPTSNRLAVHFSSDSAEWYTPRNIIDRTIAALGQIDLDPCSNSHDAPNVPARKHFTQADDGLSRLWAGRVYMNPPYGGVIGVWVKKLCDEHEAGNVPEAIALVPARVDTDWFRLMRNQAICFVDGRLKFSGQENSAPFPSAVVYFGERLGAFVQVFADLGDIWVRWGNDQWQKA